MEEEIYYWQYTVKIEEEGPEGEPIISERMGVIPASTIGEAMEALYDYYGDEIFEVHKIKCIWDLKVLDFWDMEELGDNKSDFSVVPKKGMVQK